MLFLFRAWPAAGAMTLLAAAMAPYALLAWRSREPLQRSTVSLSLALGYTVCWAVIGLLPMPVAYGIPAGLVLISTVPASLAFVAALISAHVYLVRAARAARKTLGGGIDAGLALLPAGYAIALVVVTFGILQSRENRRVAAIHAKSQEERRVEQENHMARLRGAHVVWSTPIPSRFPVPAARTRYSGAAALIPVRDGFVLAAYQTVSRVDTRGRVLWAHWLPVSANTHLRVVGDTVWANGVDSVEYRIVGGTIVGRQPPDSLPLTALRRNESSVLIPAESCSTGNWTTSRQMATLHARRRGEERSMHLSGNVRGPVCSTHRFYVLADDLLLEFEPPFNLTRTLRLVSGALGLPGRDPVFWNHASLMAADDGAVVLVHDSKDVLGSKVLYVVQDERLRAVLDDAPYPRAVVLSDYLYRLVPDSAAWRIEAVALPR
jgi:hypothetical protein